MSIRGQLFKIEVDGLSALMTIQGSKPHFRSENGKIISSQDLKILGAQVKTLRFYRLMQSMVWALIAGASLEVFYALSRNGNPWLSILWSILLAGMGVAMAVRRFKQAREQSRAVKDVNSELARRWADRSQSPSSTT